MSERRARHVRRPERARSQHFLRTQALAAELVRDACVPRNEIVFDLGAGSGRLTKELARRASRVIAVELDPHWAESLRGRWSNVEVWERDAARIRFPREPFRVVANLPFSGTGPILRNLLDDPGVPLVRADLIVQWGAALKRSVPWPSTVNGVLWGAWYTATLTRRLPRTCFRPEPAVDAGVLVFERRPEPLIPPEDWQRYRAFVARGFRHGLRRAVPTKKLRAFRLTRAEPRALDAHQWAALFRSCET